MPKTKNINNIQKVAFLYHEHNKKQIALAVCFLLSFLLDLNQ